MSCLITELKMLDPLVCRELSSAGASPGVLAVHFAFVVIQEGHWKDVVGDGPGDKLAQHL